MSRLSIRDELLREHIKYMLNEYQEENIKLINSLKADLTRHEVLLKQIRDLTPQSETVSTLLDNVKFITSGLADVLNIDQVDKNNLITIPELAEYCGISERKVRHYISRGYIPQPLKINKYYYFAKNQLEELKKIICQILTKRN